MPPSEYQRPTEMPTVTEGALMFGEIDDDGEWGLRVARPIDFALDRCANWQRRAEQERQRAERQT